MVDDFRSLPMLCNKTVLHRFLLLLLFYVLCLCLALDTYYSSTPSVSPLLRYLNFVSLLR